MEQSLQVAVQPLYPQFATTLPPPIAPFEVDLGIALWFVPKLLPIPVKDQVE